MNHRFTNVIEASDDYAILTCECSAKCKIRYKEDSSISNRSYYDPLLERWGNTAANLPKCMRVAINKKKINELGRDNKKMMKEYIINSVVKFIGWCNRESIDKSKWGDNDDEVRRLYYKYMSHLERGS